MFSRLDIAAQFAGEPSLLDRLVERARPGTSAVRRGRFDNRVDDEAAALLGAQLLARLGDTVEWLVEPLPEELGRVNSLEGLEQFLHDRSEDWYLTDTELRDVWFAALEAALRG